MGLVKHCRGILDRAEKRIEVLTQGDKGLEAKPLDAAAVMKGDAE